MSGLKIILQHCSRWLLHRISVSFLLVLKEGFLQFFCDIQRCFCVFPEKQKTCYYVPNFQCYWKFFFLQSNLEILDISIVSDGKCFIICSHIFILAKIFYLKFILKLEVGLVLFPTGTWRFLHIWAYSCFLYVSVYEHLLWLQHSHFSLCLYIA